MHSVAFAQSQSFLQLSQDAGELSATLARVKRYKLASDATLCDNIEYVLYRIWNGVKAIFGVSDWNVAERKTAQKVRDYIPLLQLILPQSQLVLVKPQILKTTDAIVKAALYLAIDNRIDAPENQTPEAQQRHIELLVDLYTAKTNIAQKLAIDAQTIRDSFSPNQEQRLGAAARILHNRTFKEILDSINQIPQSYLQTLEANRIFAPDTIEALKACVKEVKALIQICTQNIDQSLFQHTIQGFIPFTQAPREFVV